MRTIRFLSLVAMFVTLSLTACDRSFDAPPVEPDPVFVGPFEPDRGFLDTELVIHGEQFAPVAEDNIVYFGTEVAEIVSANEAGTELVVRVPELEIDSQVPIKVSTATGQASSEDLFAYRGPGHPLLEELSRGFELDSGPVALQARVGEYEDFDGQSVPVYEVLVANASARTITKVDLLTGRRMVMGLHETPGTLAAHETDDGMDVYFSHLSEDNGITKGSVSSIAFSSPSNQVAHVGEPEGGVTGMDEDNLVTIEGNWGESDANSDQQSFQPGLIQVIQYTENGNEHAKLVAADRYRNIIMVADPGILDLGGTGRMDFCELNFSASTCPDTGPTAVADMVPTADNLLLLTLKGRPEVFELDPFDDVACRLRLIWPIDQAQRGLIGAIRDAADDPLGLPALKAAWSSFQSRGLDLEFLDSLLDEGKCIPSFGPIARAEDPDEDSERLFVAELSRKQVFEFRHFEHNFILGGELDVYLPVRTLATRSPVLAATSGRSLGATLLYLVTEEGIMTVDLGETLTEKNFWSNPSAMSGPRSIGSIDMSRPIEVLDWNFGGELMLYADKAADRLLVFAPSLGPDSARSIPLGADLPMVASSRFGDIVYVSDKLSNMVQLIDQRSGLMVDQFFTGALGAFGPEIFACLHKGGEDVLLTSTTVREYVPDPENPGEFLQKIQQEILVRAASSEHDVMSMVENDAEDCSPIRVEKDDQFGQMLSVPCSDRLVMLRLGDEARVWTTALSENGLGGYTIPTPANMTADDPRFVDIALPSSTQFVSMGTDGEKLLTFWGYTDGGSPSLTLYDLSTGDECDTKWVNDFHAAFTQDIALHSDAGGAVAYLALGDLGLVAAIPMPGAEPFFIHTGNAPSGLFFSPDGRRLYVLHEKLGKLSVIDTDCSPLGACEEVVATIPLGASPALINFHPTGKAAFVSHRGNPTVCIVE
ncbi:MAG: IPT/TIG domain-containing protein [Deltaproteobacteria bacterium]|nr:IPT/TIG domain-containing protein [Deltaproteobacteria bacterium]